MGLQMYGFGVYARVTKKKNFATVGGARAMLAQPKGTPLPPNRLCGVHRVTRRQYSDFACWEVAPAERAVGKSVIYVHGGAYVNEISLRHWEFISRLANSGIHVVVPIYGLAPCHTYREAYPLLTNVYQNLLSEFSADAITIAGDSAGGGLVLGLGQELLSAGVPQPKRLVLISPWLDLTLCNPAIPEAEKRDPWLARNGLLEIGRVWAGGDDPAGSQLSPLNGPLTGLPPIEVYIGTRDILYPDVMRLRQIIASDGHPLTVTTRRGAVHIYPLTPTPEGRAETAAIISKIVANCRV